MTTKKLAGNPLVASRKQALIAVLAIACHLLLRFDFRVDGSVLGLQLIDFPLVLALALGGGLLVLELLLKLLRREFGSDLLAGISIITSVLLGEYLAEKVGIAEVRAGQTPEQKLEIVRAETRQANTVFLGDGINDAPALTAAAVVNALRMAIPPRSLTDY